MRRLIPLALLALALAISGCGSSSSVTSTDTQTDQQTPEPPAGSEMPQGGPPAGVDQDALQKVQDCLKREGVELPSPEDAQGGAGMGDIDQEAIEKCSKYFPEGAGPGGGSFAPPGQ